MPRRIIAIVCAAAGIFVLAGAGWALLAAGLLVEAAWPRGHATPPAWVAVAARRTREAVAAARRAAQRMPQQLTAAGVTAAGVALVPAGVGIMAGVGAALLVLGALGILFGLLLDRGA